MTTKTSKVYLYAITRPGEALNVHITCVDMTGEPNWTRIGEQEVTFDVPDQKEFVGDIIAGLEATRDKMRAAANAAIAEVDDHIASFLALEHSNENG